MEKEIEKKETESENKDEKGAGEDNNEGDQPKSLTLYEHTNTSTERLEKANAKTEDLLNRQEEIYQKQQLGGITEAGSKKEVEKETDEEYTERFRKGEVDILKENAPQ